MARILPSGFYVYAYYEKFGTEPIYIGKGYGARAWNHLSPCEYQAKPGPFHNKIGTLLSLGEEPDIEIIEQDLTEEQAFETERKLIQVYGRKDLKQGPLLNVTEGGDGRTGFTHTEEWKRLNGLRTTERNKGNKYGVGRIDPRRKPVIGRSLSTSFRREYSSLKAVESDGYHRILIQKALRGDGFAYGLQWSYVSFPETQTETK